jgi:predicted nucleotidyltransferase
MTDTLNKNFSNLRNKYKDLLEALEETFKKFGIDYYLIGATSRDLWIEGISSIPTARATLDFDFAIYLNDHEQFEKLKLSLIEKNFVNTSQPYRMKYRELIIDLFPFGKIEVDKTVKLLAEPPVTLSAIGFQEVFDHSVTIGKGFKIAPLYGICILKLSAFHESPDRLKDIEDFEFILENYFEIFNKEIFDEYLDLLIEDKDTRITGAKVLGIKMKNILDYKSDLKTIIVSVLRDRLKNWTKDDINDLYNENKYDKQFRKLKQILELVKMIEINE